MTPRVVLDTDFLSAFLKIDRISLIADYFETTSLSIPPAVYGELAATELLVRAADSTGGPDLQVIPPPAVRLLEMRDSPAFASLGPGEQEAIALAASAEALLLMNDNRARRVAAEAGVAVFNIPAFLLAVKESRLLDRAAIQSVVAGLIEKDHYGFRAEVLSALFA